MVNCLEEGGVYDCVYLDFSKAFDKVDYSILRRKLLDKKIKGDVATWLMDFVSNRAHKVWANGELSCVQRIVRGVPQGTVIGPILFLIMVDDIGNSAYNVNENSGGKNVENVEKH